MAKQTFQHTFEEGTILAEAYDDGQFRFIHSFTEKGEPAKNILWFNSHNFSAQTRTHSGSLSTSSLDRIISNNAEGIFSGSNELYNKGVALLQEHGITVPAQPTGYPELQALYQELCARPGIDLDDIQPGMLIAYIHPTIGNNLVQLMNIGKIEPFMDGEKMVLVEPTEVSPSFVQFGIDITHRLISAYEERKIGDYPVTETLARQYPRGKTKIVAATIEDMRKVKAAIPEEIDESLERVHYAIMDTDLDALIASDKPTEEKVATIAQFAKYSLREYPGQEIYKKACEFLVDNRDTLTSDVYICLPGGLSGNSDPAWVKVKQNSEERCSCGNERVIHPQKMDEKRDYIASDLGAVVVSSHNAVYLKPAGGTQESTYVKFSIQGNGLAFMEQPFAPFILTPNIFGSQGYLLEKLADLLPKQTKPLVFSFGKTKTPICAITAVDVSAKTVTLIPDKAVEAYQPTE